MKNNKTFKLFTIITIILVCIVVGVLYVKALIDKSASSKPWYEKYHFIAHSGGGIDGKIYSNSLDAWNLSYANGNRLFDADMRLTSDGYVVLRHELHNNLELNDVAMKDSKITVNRFNLLDFSVSQGNMTHDEFMNSKIFSKYSPMDLDTMIKFIKEHDDVYVLIDAKEELETIYTKIVEAADYDENILEHIVPSLYRYSEYEVIMNIYKFKEVGMRQYINNNLKYNELLDFMLKNNIHVLNVDIQHIQDADIKRFKENGIRIYVAVIDYISDMKYYESLGADGAVTNYLYESDWDYISK